MEIGWNPVSWVVEPLKCVFIPQTLGEQWELFQADLMVRPPASVIAAVQPLGSGVASGFGGSSCIFGPIVDHLPGRSGPVAESALPCTPAYQGSPMWTTGYALMTAAIVVGGALRLWNMTSSALGGRATGDGGGE
jgi:hypothetical protein